MHSVSGQQSWNFFKNDFTNHIPAPGFAEFPLAIKFATVTRNIQQVSEPTFACHVLWIHVNNLTLQVGVSDWSKAGEDGKEVENPRFPYKLRFHPTGDISFPDEYHQPIIDDLLTIPSGSTLYEVDMRHNN